MKPQYDPEFEFPKGTPKFAKKIVTNLASKVAPLCYMTDEPATAITTGSKSKLSVLAQMSAGFRNYKFSEASGDIVVAGMQQFPFEDEWIAKIMLLKYSADDLSLMKKNVVELEYANYCFFNKALADGTMVLLLMPQKMQKGEPDPNPLNFMYMRVNSDAEVVAQTKFQSPSRQWNVTDALLANDGAVYFYGIAETKRNDKYDIETRLTKGDNVQVVKFKDGNADYIASLNVDKLADILKKPGNQKKADAYNGKNMSMDVGTSLVAPSGDLIFSGQSDDHDAMYYFHLSPEGEFKAHYVINTEQKHKEHAIDHAIFMNANGQTATLFVAELEDIKDERALKYPRLATIDIAAADISNMTTYGYSKKEKYYLDDVYPTTFIADDRVVFFSRDAKDKEIWLGRVKLGK